MQEMLPVGSDQAVERCGSGYHLFVMSMVLSSPLRSMSLL
jgi:hypothetical protein